MTPLSPELSAQIDRESKNDDINDDWDIAYAGGYKDAGTKYGAKWERAKKALEDVLQQIGSLLDGHDEKFMWDTLRATNHDIKTLLSTWKEEGNNNKTDNNG